MKGLMIGIVMAVLVGFTLPTIAQTNSPDTNAQPQPIKPGTGGQSKPGTPGVPGLKSGPAKDKSGGTTGMSSGTSGKGAAGSDESSRKARQQVGTDKNLSKQVM